jgi:hypothetical protein
MPEIEMADGLFARLFMARVVPDGGSGSVKPHETFAAAPFY